MAPRFFVGQESLTIHSYDPNVGIILSGKVFDIHK